MAKGWNDRRAVRRSSAPGDGAFGKISQEKRRGLSIESQAPSHWGHPVREAIAAGPVRVITDIGKLQGVQAGDVLVAESTDPDWKPVVRRVAAIVVNQGGGTAHAAIALRSGIFVPGRSCRRNTAYGVSSILRGSMTMSRSL